MPRPKGSPNKVTAETKQFLLDIVEGEHPRIRSALQELYSANKAHYLTIVVKLLPFITPKASEVHINGQDLPVKAPSWFETTETS